MNQCLKKSSRMHTLCAFPLYSNIAWKVKTTFNSMKFLPGVIFVTILFVAILTSKP